MKDRFPSNDPIPLFLSDLAEEPEQSGIRKVISSEIFRKIALVFAAAAVVFGVVSVGNLILFARVTASKVSTSAPQDGSGHSMPAIQSTATPVQPPQPVQDARTHIVQKPPLPKRRPIQAEQTARVQDPSPQDTHRPFSWRN